MATNKAPTTGTVGTIDKAQALKILRATLYIAVSSALGFLTAVLADNPMLFGVFTPIINVILVTLRQVFTEKN